MPIRAWLQLVFNAVAPVAAHRSKPRRATAGRFRRVEVLEDRMLLAVMLTADEQLMLELINRARANPDAEAAMTGGDTLQDQEHRLASAHDDFRAALADWDAQEIEPDSVSPRIGVTDPGSNCSAWLSTCWISLNYFKH